MKKKKWWRLRFPVEAASGSQTYEVEAESAEAAHALWKTDCYECVCEELEVERLGEPDIEEIKD